MTLFLLANAHTCAARLLDCCAAHTAHTQTTTLVGPVQTVLGNSHGCNPSTSCPSDRSALHSCVVAVCHLIHTRPPDIHVICLAYQRLMSNTYSSSSLVCAQTGPQICLFDGSSTFAIPGTRPNAHWPLFVGRAELARLRLDGSSTLDVAQVDNKNTGSACL
jgi:hypothetical protein